MSQSEATAEKDVVLNPEGRRTGPSYTVRVRNTGTSAQQAAVSQNLTMLLRSMIDAEVARQQILCDTENIHAER